MREALQVAIVGIDGSGKSTLAAALAAVIAGDRGLVAGSAVADEFWVRAPNEDLCAPGFHPHGYSIAARLDRVSRWLSRVLVDNKALYPSAKVFQMLLQDNAAVKLAGRYRADVMISDGNLMLSGAGRAFNYRGPAADPPSAADIDHAFKHLLKGTRLGPESRRHLPDLKTAEALAGAARLFRWRGVWIPDQVVFLDISPEASMARVRARGGKVDRHENPSDLAIARDGYLRVMDAVLKAKGPGSTHVIDVGSLSPGEVVAAAMKELEPYLASAADAARAGALHTPTSKTSLAARVFSYQYLARYLLRCFFEGAWREPFFPLSKPGKIFLRDGYSAGVMRLIYDKPANAGLLERIWYGYPLHRAVYDRLGILQRRIEAQLRARLAGGGEVRIFTGPSGFAYDLFGPLRKLAAEDADQMKRVRVVAADLDPTGELGPELAAVAEKVGVEFRFLRGDMTGSELRKQGERDGPYDLALFVGLSAWLPKPPTFDHLRWLRANLRPGGKLVTDCFTIAAYAVGGVAMGYRASYYPPPVFRILLDYCGFDGLGADVESGRDKINHVVVASTRRT